MNLLVFYWNNLLYLAQEFKKIHWRILLIRLSLELFVQYFHFLCTVGLFIDWLKNLSILPEVEVSIKGEML